MKKTEIDNFGRTSDENRNLNEILVKIGDFGRTKSDILGKVFLMSLNMLVAQYIIVLVEQCKISTHVKHSNFSMKQTIK